MSGLTHELSSGEIGATIRPSGRKRSGDLACADSHTSRFGGYDFVLLRIPVLKDNDRMGSLKAPLKIHEEI